MTGGRLPDGYDVLDAELAAIVVALHKTILYVMWLAKTADACSYAPTAKVL